MNKIVAPKDRAVSPGFGSPRRIFRSSLTTQLVHLA